MAERRRKEEERIIEEIISSWLQMEQ